MSSLSLRQVVKSFGSTRVLEGVDAHIEQGEVFAILGPSGSGKTTLLRSIAGFESIDGGEITVGTKVVSGLRVHVVPEKRGVTIVPQDQALFPHLDVAANIGFGVHRRERNARVDELLVFAGLEGLGSRMPHQLSGGQQQRVALARALAPRPALLLLDEPFTGLDASLRATIREDISALLRSSGTTAVLVTHDQEEALSIADRVAVLRSGRVVQVGTPAEIYGHPVDLGVASFIGEVNVLAAQIESGQAQTTLGGLSPSGSVQSGPAHVIVRPEQLEIIAGDDAVIVDRLYFGHDAMVIAELDTGEQIRIRAHGPLPDRSQRVGLRVHGKVICYPSENGVQLAPAPG